MAETQPIDYLLSEGDSLLAIGNKPQAFSRFQAAVNSDPKNEHAWMGLAKATGDVDEAIQALGRVTTLNPGNIEARNLRLSLQVDNLRGAMDANMRAYQQAPPRRYLVQVLIVLDVLIYGLFFLMLSRANGWLK